MYYAIVKAVQDWIDFDVETNLTDDAIKIDISIEIPLTPLKEYIQSFVAPEPSE